MVILCKIRGKSKRLVSVTVFLIVFNSTIDDLDDDDDDEDWDLILDETRKREEDSLKPRVLKKYTEKEW